MSAVPACGGCGGPHRFDTSIPSVVWNEVIRGAGHSDYLCTSCIVAVFARAGRGFTATLYGAGLDWITLDVRIGGQVADDAHRINEQNNTLRVALDEIREKADGALTAACRPPVPWKCEDPEHPDCKGTRRHRHGHPGSA